MNLLKQIANAVHHVKEIPFIVDDTVAQQSQTRNQQRLQRVTSRVCYVGSLKSQADDLDQQTKKMINKLLEK